MKKIKNLTITVLVLMIVLSALYSKTVFFDGINASDEKKDDVKQRTVVEKKVNIHDFDIELEAGRSSVEKTLKLNEGMIYENYYVEMPLYGEDYYYGKHINAKSATSELNQMPVLRAGDRVEVINDGYLSMDKSYGYVKPGEKFYYASGVCWSVSTLGLLMDDANAGFIDKYGIPLFTFDNGDRYPHSHSYKTYNPSNYGYGYTVVKVGDYATDYKFTVNPEIETIAELEDFEIKIVLNARNDHGWGYGGESIEGYILTNKDLV